MPDEEYILIKQSEYDLLKADSDWLACLENAGVDNWSGYDYAIELKYEGLHGERDC